jgi:O-antigen/teichoic acid export membrane protein
LALGGSLTYGLVLAAGLAVSRWQGWVSPFSGFVILGLSSVGASLLLWSALELGEIELSWSRVKSAIPKILRQHWHYAKWVLGSSFVFWLGGVVYAPLVGSFAGLEAAGAFQAMQNLLKPLQNVFAAFGLLFLPWVSRQRAIQGAGKANRIMLMVLAAIFAAACAYTVSLLLARHWFVRMLYGQGYYSGFLWLLPYLCVASIIGSLLQGLSIWLKAFERPNAAFWSQTAGAAMTLSVGLYLVWNFKLLGAAAAIILVNVVTAFVLSCFLRCNLRATR